MKEKVLVVGAGEVGGPLAKVLSGTYDVVIKDVEPLALESVEVMHICYPYDPDKFVSTAVEYMELYTPAVTIVNSTIVPGVTRQIGEKSGRAVAYSPVRGKHTRMAQDLVRYAKFISSPQTEALERTRSHFLGAGMRVCSMESPEALELAKLLETSYFGVLLGWAQEMERFAGRVGADYLDVQQFMEEIDYLPRVVFQPGYVGGHCVLPNSFLLDQVGPSLFMDAMRESNKMKAREWEAEGRSLDERVSPLEIASD